MTKSENSFSTVIPVYKFRGETPLEALGRLRAAFPEYKDLPMTYAGRLDPMAEGLLIILAGEECKQKDTYLGLSKSYEVEVCFGISTDTGDMLGVPTIGVLDSKITEASVKETVAKLVGVHDAPYPAYSSKTVQGKPLFSWARAGKLAEIEIPEKRVEIFEATFLGIRNEQLEDVVVRVVSDIAEVTGDFRQSEITRLWQKVGEEFGENDVVIAKMSIRASSGAYMRYFSEYLGQQLGTVASALSIKRIAIGEWRILP